jgi:hypothetical protein
VLKHTAAGSRNALLYFASQLGLQASWAAWWTVMCNMYWLIDLKVAVVLSVPAVAAILRLFGSESFWL